MKEYRAGIYLRLSKEQEGENNSIEIQREITTKYAALKGYKVIKEYADNGYSGILDSRPALDEMMTDILKGFINMVIVKDISRLTRNKNKTGWYTEIFFPDNDVRFISVTESIDSGKYYEIDDSIMLRGIANQYYIADISKKIRSNKNAMKESGIFVESRVPYGYMKDKENIHKVIIDENVANNIREIYNMYINGKTSGQIAESFNKEKINSPSKYMKLKNMSKQWSAEQINDILINPFYIGNTIINKYKTNYITKTCKKNKDRDTWIIKENTHDAIIEKEKYDKVQEIKASKKVKSQIKYEYLLKDLVYCGHCNTKFQYKVYKSKKSQRYLYENCKFNCSLLYKKRCNNKTSIKEKNLNGIVKKEVIKRLNLLKIDENTNKLIDYYKENAPKMQRIKEYQKQMERLERKKNVLYNKKCEQYITAQEFKIEYNKVKEEIARYKSLIKKIEHENILDEKREKDIIQKIKNKDYITNDFLKEIIDKIKIYSKNRIEIIYKL